MSHFWINMTSRVCWFKYLQWKFESQTCNSTYSSPGDLQKHILSTHEQESMLSLVSHASSDSWMYVTCKTCDMKFQTDEDMNHVSIWRLRISGTGHCKFTEHINEAHISISEAETSDNDLEDLGIT